MSRRCSYRVEDIFGGSPRKCKREAQKGNMFCWQHSELRTPTKTPQKKEPSSKKTKKKVHFADKITVKPIPPRDKKVRGGIAWAEPVTDLQAECISSVLDVYGIWDREDLEKAKGLDESDKRLVKTCLRIMEGDMPSSPYRKELLAFSANRERKRDVYRKMTIFRENEKL